VTPCNAALETRILGEGALTLDPPGIEVRVDDLFEQKI
jgi:hypothetical protein